MTLSLSKTGESVIKFRATGRKPWTLLIQIALFFFFLQQPSINQNENFEYKHLSKSIEDSPAAVGLNT